MLRVRTTFAGIPGTPYLSTMYFSGDDTQTGANNAVTAVGAFWNTIDPSLISGLTWSTEPAVDVLTTDGVLTGSFGTTPIASGGATAGVLAPVATQGLLRWSTNAFVSGRRIRGRTFIPGIPTAMVSGGAPTGSLVTNAATAAANLISATANFGVWSRKNGSWTEVTSGGLWTQFAVLRSRRD